MKYILSTLIFGLGISTASAQVSKSHPLIGKPVTKFDSVTGSEFKVLDLNLKTTPFNRLDSTASKFYTSMAGKIKEIRVIQTENVRVSNSPFVEKKQRSKVLLGKPNAV